MKLAKYTTGRYPMVAFEGSYHGMTSGALSLCSGRGFKEDFLPLLPEVHFVPFAYCYCCPFKRESESCDLECAQYLDHILDDPHSGVGKPAAVPFDSFPGADNKVGYYYRFPGAFWAAGQNCIGVQRILIHEEVYEAFRDRFVTRTKRYKIGNKQDEDCDMGPMINEQEAIRIETWVGDAVRQGAHLLCGGKRSGALYEPTVLEKVTSEMKVEGDEVYAPVVRPYRISSLEQAIEKANEVPYGLHAAIFARDLDVAFQAA